MVCVFGVEKLFFTLISGRNHMVHTTLIIVLTYQWMGSEKWLCHVMEMVGTDCS